MYKVIIVDDELQVINSLSNRIDWVSKGFEIIDKARNGTAAYDLILKHKPDIVFTDIRMAGMNGLELIEKVNELSLDIYFVVISGYAEFSYAQKALNIGAVGFCLKPFDEEEIECILNNVRSKIEKQRRIYETELLSLMESCSADKSLSFSRILQHMGLNNENDKEYIAAVSVGAGCLIINDGFRHVCMKIGSKKYFYIIENTSGIAMNNFNYKNILKDGDIPSDISGIGMSRVFKSYEYLKEAYEESNITAYNFFVSGKKQEICQYVQQGKDSNIDNVIRTLCNVLVLKDPVSAFKIINRLGSMFMEQNYSIQYALRTYNNFISLFEKDNDDIQENSLESYEQLTELFPDVYEMLAHLKELSTKNEDPCAGTNVREHNGESVNETYKRISCYINDNFSKEITVQSIAGMLKCNANYISQMFKREGGESITEYLIKVRIEHACEMLKSEHLAVYEVAEKVGYKDYFHFAKMFKRMTGKTPTEFRNGQLVT